MAGRGLTPHPLPRRRDMDRRTPCPCTRPSLLVVLEGCEFYRVYELLAEELAAGADKDGLAAQQEPAA